MKVSSLPLMGNSEPSNNRDFRGSVWLRLFGIDC